MVEVQNIPILSVVSGKGGVGKTTFCLAIAQELAAGKNNVLILDIDFSNRGLTEHLSGVVDQDDLTELQEPVAAPNEGCENKVARIRQIDSNIVTVVFPVYSQEELGLFESLSLCKGREFINQVIHSVMMTKKVDVVLLDCRGSRDALSFAAATVSDHVFVVSTDEKITFLGTLRFIKGVRNQISNSPATRMHLVFNRVSDNVRSSTLSYWYQQHFREYFDDDDVLSIIPLDAEASLATSTKEFPTRGYIYSSMADKVRVLVSDLFRDDSRISVSKEARFVASTLGMALRPRLPVGAIIIDGKFPHKVLMTSLALIFLVTVGIVGVGDEKFSNFFLNDENNFLIFSGVSTCLVVIFAWMTFTYLCRFMLREDGLLVSDLAYRGATHLGMVVWRVVLVCLGILVLMLGIELGRQAEADGNTEALFKGFLSEEGAEDLFELSRLGNMAVGIVAYIMVGVFGLIFILRSVRVLLFRIKSMEFLYRVVIVTVSIVLGVIV